jgi:hypothetical protein
MHPNMIKVGFFSLALASCIIGCQSVSVRKDTVLVKPSNINVTPSPSVSNPPEKDFLKEASTMALTAQEITKTAAYPEEWELAITQSQQAILALESAPANHSQAELIQEKLKEYRDSQEKAKAELGVSKILARASIQAEKAINLTDVARSPDDWKVVAAFWQQAIELLKSLPFSRENSTVLAETMAEYQREYDRAMAKVKESGDS